MFVLATHQQPKLHSSFLLPAQRTCINTGTVATGVAPAVRMNTGNFGPFDLLDSFTSKEVAEFLQNVGSASIWQDLSTVARTQDIDGSTFNTCTTSPEDLVALFAEHRVALGQSKAMTILRKLKMHTQANSMFTAQDVAGTLEQDDARCTTPQQTDAMKNTPIDEPGNGTSVEFTGNQRRVTQVSSNIVISAKLRRQSCTKTKSSAHKATPEIEVKYYASNTTTGESRYMNVSGFYVWWFHFSQFIAI